MSSNLSLGTSELKSMHTQGGGDSLWGEAFKRLRRDKIAMMGGITIIALIILAILASILSPHDPNKQYANGTSAYGLPLPIGAYSKTMTIQLAKPAAKEILLPNALIYFFPDGKYEFKARQDVVIPMGETQVTIPVNPLTPEMASAPNGIEVRPENPLPIPVSNIQVNNEQIFFLGTDANGRDVLSRLIFGSRVSLEVGGIAILLAMLIGCTLGVLSGYFGGWVDMGIMRLTDIMMSFPDLLLVMAIVSVVNPGDISSGAGVFNWLFGFADKVLGLDPGVIIICIAIATVSWTQFARIVRGQVLSVREMEFVEASRAIGAKDSLIMFRHILPNVMAPVIVISTMGIAGAIMTEASLSFLGFGVKVPTASWGSMINDGLGYFRESPLIPLVPGLAIAITVFAFNLFGDGLRDALDPRLK